MQRTSVLVVDDSVTIRAMIENMLEQDGRIEVAGVASNTEDALKMIDLYDPDVVTVDINMPGADGWQLLEQIMLDLPRPVIMLSSLVRDGDSIIDLAKARGAAACFNKSLLVRETARFIDMIREVRARQLAPILPDALIGQVEAEPQRQRIRMGVA